MTSTEESPTTRDGELRVPARPVGSLITRQMLGIAPGSTLRDAVAVLVEGDVGVVIVMEGGELKGVISERDLIDAVHEGTDLDATLVDEIMQPDIISVDPATTVVDAARTMIQRGVRHLVVEEPNAGVVSIRAAMRSILGE